jgi:DhnA family fructose-bisphosphate aldolase class Ia
VVLQAKAIELGASYALESGVDGIALPWPGRNSFEIIRVMAAGVPLWIKPSAYPLAQEADEALDSGATGLWLDERLFTQPDPVALAGEIYRRVHLSPQASQEA